MPSIITGILAVGVLFAFLHASITMLLQVVFLWPHFYLCVCFLSVLVCCRDNASHRAPAGYISIARMHKLFVTTLSILYSSFLLLKRIVQNAKYINTEVLSKSNIFTMKMHKTEIKLIEFNNRYPIKNNKKQETANEQSFTLMWRSAKLQLTESVSISVPHPYKINSFYPFCILHVPACFHTV